MHVELRHVDEMRSYQTLDRLQVVLVLLTALDQNTATRHEMGSYQTLDRLQVVLVLLAALNQNTTTRQGVS